jgi:hypothetical protein
MKKHEGADFLDPIPAILLGAVVDYGYAGVEVCVCASNQFNTTNITWE